MRRCSWLQTVARRKRCASHEVCGQAGRCEGSDGGAAVKEYAILDRAGRVQIPREMLEEVGISGQKVRLEIRDGCVVLAAPKEESG